MSDPHEPVPRDPEVPVETPESRMTGEGSPSPGHEEERGPQDGSEDESTEPAHEPEPHEPPD
ncbi:hypothetical protein [Streptomyces sp. CBMA156]|uniref:hypothetical protein n=1 Tax=Streptomyces sp. CBMA156 TaxID=1930280 RepID=UPI001661A4F6|nr:hypothetical protein [Streptomyces sp. CBMA156]MBD0676078.1 hypothetical protein [Streptomyces sp. CBMA156]